MEADLRMFLEPTVALLMSVEIVEDDVQLAIGEAGDDMVHEAEELDAAPPLGMRRNDPARGNFERTKQRRGAVPLVVMALAGQGASVRQLQIALCPLQRLDRGLLVDTQDNRLGRRINVKADHVGRLRGELRVVALAPGLPRSQIDVVLAQETPNILNVDVFERLRQQRASPPGIACGRRLIQKRQNPLASRRTVNRRLGSTRAIVQSGKPVIGKAVSPFAHDARLNTYFLRDRARAAPMSCQQHYPRPLHIALRRARHPAARCEAGADSAAGSSW